MKTVNPFLPRDEREAHSEFEDELFHLPENSRFEVIFAVGVLRAQKTQEVRIAKHEVRGKGIPLPELSQFLPDQYLRLLRQGRPLEEHAADLLSQRVDAPALDPAHLRVEIPLERGLELKNLDKMAPPQLS
jgi:hypothetical protein